MPEYPIRVSVQLDQATADDLTARAEELDRPVAWIVRQAIREYLDRQPDPG